MRRFATRHLCFTLALLGLPAWADPAGLQRCRAIADATARLACYDALATSATAPVAPGFAGAPPVGKAGAPAPAPSAADQFGLESRRPAGTPDAVESQIPGQFEGWKAGDRIALANGQVWRIADGSQGALWLQNPKVRVRRGVLGAFYLEIEGTNRSPRVERVK